MDRAETFRILGGQEPPTKGKLGVCIRPLYGPYDDAMGLIEFLAYYSALGTRSKHHPDP